MWGKKTNKNSLAAKVSMDMKGTPSPVVNEKKGKKELSFDSSTSLLTNKEKDKKEQSSGHLTSPLKANEEENTKKPSLSHLTSPLKTNKKQDMKEPKIKPSSKRSRKMATNIGDIMSSTAPSTIGTNKRQKKCQQEIPRTRLKVFQPVKKNANEKPNMECQQEMTRAQLKESQPVKKNANERTTLQPWNKLCNSLRFYVIRKNGWVVGEIINAVALRKSLIQSKRDPDALWPSWYLPTYLASYALNGVQEPGSDDCDVHIAKYFDLEQFNEEEAAKLRFNSEEGRNSLILDLILCGENVIRNEVIRKVQEKYRNTRRIIRYQL
ncbi:hypothetical protein RHSIM_Rhsim09G0070200 [Rhododendron simsii]|uniref:Uncharacterized protein n=1 Tax=Rhododendron simsii TaxID=118357 RepID=A0A834GJZ4_RHOSS|nr:hypothetical protein RHSIM_Rhsim09G0070200 [Rhododendron simsii]